MAINSRRIRPLLTLAFVLAGIWLGCVLQTHYTAYLDSYLLSGTKAGTPKLFGIIPINRTQLTAVDKTSVSAGFIALGLLIGLLAESISFAQYKRACIRFETMTPHDKIASGIGLFLGLIVTALLVSILKTTLAVNIVIAVLLCYTWIVVAESLKEQIRFYFPDSSRPSKGEYKLGYRPKLLDTNVIIDGRIADVCRAGFIEGPIYVPRFVLEELQQIADSSDSLKRARGRRGLDILNQMQKEMELKVPAFAADDSDEEVDARLVIVAKEIDGAIITNDYNLNRVAELQGVDVLNINELANALKPVVLPGEEMTVTIIKEGKEKDQGIGYLDDGTMIVVEGARRMIGETMDVSVTSVLQTVQGKMIFAKVKDFNEQGSSLVEDSIRSYTGGRTRRKIR